MAVTVTGLVTVEPATGLQMLIAGGTVGTVQVPLVGGAGTTTVTVALALLVLSTRLIAITECTPVVVPAV